MRKLALFVEGDTEQAFFERLLVELAGSKNIVVDSALATTNVLSALQLRHANVPGARYFVLLMNCRNDERVRSVIIDRHETLSKAGYSLVLGIRDLYPNPLADLAKVRASLTYGIPTTGVPTYVLLAVAEIEAWFLQEELHYARLDPGLNIAQFKAAFGFDPIVDCAENVTQPSRLLQTIYNSVGKGYRKKRDQVAGTVSVLDYENIYAVLPSRLPHLQEFLRHCDAFMSEAPA